MMRPLHIPKIDFSLSARKPAYEDQPVTPGRKCYLLCLPPELRSRIWEEVLIHNVVLWVDPEGVPIDRIRNDVLTDGRRFQYLPSEPALTRTCRKIRLETLPIFYGRNIFSDTPVDLCCIKFLIYLTPAKRKMLKQIRISHWKYYAEIFLHLDAGPAGTDFTSVQARLVKMNQWLQRGGLDLPDDAVHFPLRLSKGERSTWINSDCKISEFSCYGN